LILVGLTLVMTASGSEGKKSRSRVKLSPLAEYLEAYRETNAAVTKPAGSLWTSDEVFSDMSADLRAHRVNDLMTIRIVEQTLAEASADVSAARSFQAQSGIKALAGQVDTSGISSLFSPQSEQSLTGKGQSNSQSRLRTSVAGRVAAVLPNGVMVVEAERRVRMNNETQTIVLRGIVRPSDVLSDNTIFSTALANLEVELKGKGVVSDATRPPNRLVRALLWLVGF
jgi:flagellar L-ring protein precursor FlgH